MEIARGDDELNRVVPYDAKTSSDIKTSMSPVPHGIVEAIAEKLDITEPAEVAMLREQDALAVARARAQVHEDDEDEDQDPQELADSPAPGRVPSPEASPSKPHPTAEPVAPTNTIESIIALASDAPKSSLDHPHYEPLRGQWHYGQAVLARFRRTPYFYSGNIATYLGAGLFMIVFDDGSLNYRVKREDIVIRPLPTERSGISEGDAVHGDDMTADEGGSMGDQQITWYRQDVYLSDKPVMVDFSASPPRQVSAGRAGYEVTDEDWLDVKHLECGVAYEDDSTQVSDSDESSEEDMTMTPWQQMTQTFGMGMGGGGGGHRHKQNRASTRRSSISSLSQIDRLSMTGKSMNQILPSPKGIKQTIQDYIAKKTKKVQPSTVCMDPLSEVIRKMEIRRDDINAIRSGRGTTYRTSFSGGSPVPRSPSPRATGPRLERSRSTTGTFHSTRGGGGGRDRSASAAASASFTVTSIGSTGSTAITSAQSSAQSIAGSPSSTRVVFLRESDGVRAYGTVMSRLPNGDYEVVTENEQTISVQILPAKDLDFLPSLNELDAQIHDLQQQNKRLYAGRKVQVNLYPGTRFSGNGVITLEDDTVKADKSSTTATSASCNTSPQSSTSMFHVLLQNRIRLINVPADKIVPVKEKKKEPVRITEDQFLLCHGKVKVHIGDQVFVKCEGEYEGQIEEKLGVLNGVFSNKTAAIDFADGSTGYEIPPSLITKRKRVTLHEDLDLLSLKNAVLMQAAASSSPDGFQVEVGYQVKADHPVRASVETCVVIRKHESSACDLKFADGTMAFGVFPSQMIMDKNAVDATMDKAPLLHDAKVGEIVLAWSSRFMRYCSAKISAKTTEAAQALYTVVFDYGEQKDRVPAEKIAKIDDPDALPPPQKLTNYTFDTIGFEIQPVTFSVGEAVMARVQGSIQYFNGWVESVREQERTCTVVFDSSVRDEHIKFSSMFSVDVRNRFRSLGQQTCSASSTGTGVRGQLDENSSDVGRVTGGRNKRRHSAGSMGSIIMSVAGSIFQARKKAERIERRSSHLITEVGAIMKHRAEE